uniref:Small ribosomal subunit protein mS29 n=1 Tax=Oryza barthii TaxID=65489 RepID=A0A0D3GNF9_9ORYZ
MPPTYDPALDVGPGGRPLFAFTDTFASFSRRDANAYVDFTLDEWKAMLPEGLPAGMMKEFQETRRCAVMDFLKYNENRLQQLPCQIFEPIPLGEGAGVGMMKGADTVEMPEGSTLYDLIQTGITHSHASVGVVVRLRKELSLVKDVPVLFAIDQVNAYRPMLHNDMMVGAFSHSTAVGKLRQDLPDVPSDARVMFPRYTVNEAETVCHYYMRQKIIKRENFSEEKWKKIYYLSNGNGSEMRWLAAFI